MKTINLGNIEVLILKDLGRMSYNRAKKIRNEKYGGRPWRFPSLDEMRYILSLHKMGICNLLSNEYMQTHYFTNQAYSFSNNDIFVFNIKNGHLMGTNTKASVGFLILVKSI
jgi:hypothetical protein